MFYQLPPVGNPVCLSRVDDSEDLSQVFGTTYQPHFFDSGTAALAAAIAVAVHLKNVGKPEVLLPAYSCPDLISAAVFAGVKPVLIDFEADRPWMDLEQVSAKISEQTVAIIAVDLFGLSERLVQLRLLAEQAGAVLIEDSAQTFPSRKESDIWQGDLVVLSFGRGKPVSLLGGGAVLVGKRELSELLPQRTFQAYESVRQRFLFRLKATVYNALISPRLYWLLQSLPFLHLGETRYHPLGSIEGMDQAALSVLPVNINTYRDRTVNAQRYLVELLSKLDLEGLGITDLPSACKTSEYRRLLRYPLLVEPDSRDRLYDELQRSGLGPSRMYPAVLPEISGLESLLLRQGAFPAAASFARRVLTLPTHPQVSQADIVKMSQVLSS